MNKIKEINASQLSNLTLYKLNERELDHFESLLIALSQDPKMFPNLKFST